MLYPCIFNSTLSFIRIPFCRTIPKGINGKYTRSKLRNRRHLLFITFPFSTRVCVGEGNIKGYRKQDLKIWSSAYKYVNYVYQIFFELENFHKKHQICTARRLIYSSPKYICTYLLVGLLLSVMPVKLVLLIILIDFVFDSTEIQISKFIKMWTPYVRMRSR